VATIFTQIINGEEPARFVWRDPRCVGFLSASPLRPGHTLLVPIEEVDHWIDLDQDLACHLVSVAQILGRVLQETFRPKKVGLLIAGFDVPHVHVHLVPIETIHDLHHERPLADPAEEAMDDALERIRVTLRSLGYAPP
jgi:histidine triad (HIT) family protein